MGEKIKIVMIDDEEDLCDLVKANLEMSGQYEVTICHKPVEAEAVVKAVMPELILMDVVMPQLKGNELAPKFKADPQTKNIPIVLVSGRGEMVYNKRKEEFRWMPNNLMVSQRGQLPEARGTEALAAAYGVDDYISKPFTMAVLTQVIADVLARTRRG